ncbi:hypothetical protein [Vibrio cyclitrophicus]|uniref:hypothetical protein n=1 Tax=Vibrio cyclitrophicus TaxID=47951 RepID=UPI0032E41F4E
MIKVINKLNKAKLTLFIANVVNFIVVVTVVMNWLAGVNIDNWTYLACTVLTLAVSWVPIISTGFLVAFLNHTGANDLLIYAGALSPLAVYLTVILLFPNRITVPSKL